MPSAQCLVFPPFYLDLTTEALWRGSQRLPLRPKAWSLLRYLVEHPQRLITQAELLKAIWQREYVSDGLLRGSIRELRRVLQDEATAPRFIETVSGRGYRFIAPVTAMTTPSPLPVSAAFPQPPRAAPPAHEVSQSAPTAAALEAEHKLVTILCGALSEAPALAAQLGPERWYRLLQTVAELTQAVLHPYGGTLTLSTGEGFTAVFGAPVAQEDHARRAVVAALELLQRLYGTPALHAQLAGNVLSLSLGLHSGRVVVGGLGPAPQPLATAVGAPLHIATRLQQEAAPGAILLSAATYQLVHAEIRATPCGSLILDGQSTPVSVYAVQGLLQRHAGVAGRGPRAHSPFVGRERELGPLQEHLAEAMAGQGRVVGIVGAPGMGKTRLLREFFLRIPGNQVAVYVGQCLSYGQGIPYLPVRDLVRQLCGLAEGAEIAVHATAVQQRLHENGITSEDDVALVLQLLDLPAVTENLAGLSPEARQVRTFALLRHLVLEMAQRQPLVLVLENLHWSDPTSEAWLASLVERLSGVAVLLLGTYRPGYQPAWGAHAAVTQIALPPLRAPESWSVVQSVLGEASLSETRVQALVAQGGGNPFFLEELAWHAVEQGGRDTPEAVPETVHAVLAARIDRLPPEAKHLLQTAAVIGTEVPVPLLQALAEYSEATLHRGLAHLQAAEFLYETRLFPEPVYTFKHALTHEVAYSSLLQEQRRTLHARIVEVLEALSPDRLAEQVDRLAHHALQGVVWDKALPYCRQAGTKARAASAWREAVGWLEQGLEALAHLPPDRTTQEQAVDMRCDLCMALQTLLPVTQSEQILTHLRAAEVLAEELADQRRLGIVYRRLANTLRNMQDYEAALAYSQRAHALGTALGDVGLQLEGNLAMGWIYHDLGNNRLAIEYLQQVLTVLQGEPRSQSFGLERNLLGNRPGNRPIVTRAWMVRCLSELGAFADGLAYVAEMLEFAEAVDRPYDYQRVYYAMGYLHVRQGTLHQAIPLLERALALSQEADMALFYGLAATYLALAYALAGRATDALHLLGQIEGNLVVRGEAYLFAGEVEEADRLAQRGLAHVREHKMRGQEARALWLLGEIAMRRDLPDIVQAATHYHHALALAEELDMRPLQAHCHLGLGTLYSTTGQQQQAQAELSTAIDLYRAMDMALWLPQAKAALAQVA